MEEENQSGYELSQTESCRDTLPPGLPRVSRDWSPCPDTGPQDKILSTELNGGRGKTRLSETLMTRDPGDVFNLLRNVSTEN